MAKIKKIKLKTNRKPYAFTRTILFLSIAALICVLLFSGLLPWKYLMSAIGVLLCVWLFFSIALKAKEGGRKPAKTFFSFIAFLLSILFFISSFVIIDVLSQIFGVFSKGNETDTISIVVLADSGIENLNELKKATFGVISLSLTEESNAYAINQLTDKLGKSFSTQIYDDEEDFADALYDSEVSALILSENHRSLISETDADFENKTKVIYTIKRYVKTESSDPVADVTSDPFIVYISGLDTYGSISATSRSDLNMIAVVNPATKNILLVGIPRDYYVGIEGTNMKDKLTHTGIYGIDCTLSAVENLLDIDINYYVKLNFTSAVSVIDALGGIDVYSEYSFYSADLDYTVQADVYNHMNGEQALMFARERYSLPEGDKDRVKNQMKVIEAVFDKMMTPSALINYKKILTSITDGIETDLSPREMLGLIRMQLGDMADWKISTISLNGESAYKTTYTFRNTTAYVMVPYEDSIEAAQRAIDDILGE